MRAAAVACALGVFGAGSVAVATGAFAADGEPAHDVVTKVDVVATDFDELSNDDPCPVYHPAIEDVGATESDPAVVRFWSDICDDEIELRLRLVYEIDGDGYANVQAQGVLLAEVCIVGVICSDRGPTAIKTNDFRIPPDGKLHKRTVTLDDDEGWVQFSIFLTNSPR